MSGPSFEAMRRPTPTAPPTVEPAPITHSPQSETGKLLEGLAGKYEARGKAPARQPTTETREIVASLRAARHAFDETRPKATVGEIAAQARMAKLHIDHAAHLAGHQSSDELTTQGALVGQSLIRFVEQAQHAHAAITKDASIGALGASYARLKQALTLPDVERSPSYEKELRSDATYHSPILHQTLQRISATAEQGLAVLAARPQPERDATVDVIASQLDAYAIYANGLVADTPHAKRAEIREEASVASAHVARLHRWIERRTAHKNMLLRLQPATSTLDAMLGQLQLPLLKAGTTVFSDGEEGSFKKEEDALEASKANLESALVAVENRQLEGITAFQELADADKKPKANFIESLLISTFVAMLGNLGAQILGTLLSKALNTGMGSAIKGLPPAADLIQVHGPVRDVSLLVDVTSDTIQPIVSAALADSGKAESQARARIFFMSGLRTAVSDRIRAMNDRITKRKGASDISAAELDALRLMFDETKGVLKNHYFEHALHAWTTYVAQANLGTKGKGKATVANMDHYFGGHRGPYRDPLTAKQGRDGVLHVHLHVDPAGTRPRVAHDKTEILGMNEEVAKAVAKAAGYRLARVRLPKELHVHTRSGNAVIAIDEHDQVRDSKDWGAAIARETGILHPERFWRVWGERVVIQ